MVNIYSHNLYQKFSGVSGGVTEAVLRTAADAVAGTPQDVSNLQTLRALQGIKTTTLNIGGRTINTAVVSGITNAKKFLSEIEHAGVDKCGFHFIEIMACPNGCIGGGGQVFLNNIFSLHE